MKFNLKDYVKISGDEHIESRLRKSHEDSKDVINEKQLEDYRATEVDSLTEKQLDSKRGGNKEASELVEKRLDTDKSRFANKYRNPDAYKGAINKLEEKRLANNPVEKEKYEAASTTGKKLRWWENTEDPMGMKLARNRRLQRKAQFEDFEDDYDGGELDEDTMDLINQYSLTPQEESMEEVNLNDQEDVIDPFVEVSQGSDNSTGTPTYWGKIEVQIEIDDRNKDMVINDISDFIDVKHPELVRMKKSLDLSQIDDGIVEYTAAPVVSVDEEDMDMVASNNFPIIIAHDIKKN